MFLNESYEIVLASSLVGQVEICGDYVIYCDYIDWCTLWSYNLTTKEHMTIASGLYEPLITVNNADMVYAIETKLSSTSVAYFSINDWSVKTLKIAETSNYDPMYFDGVNLYWNSKTYNPSTLEIIGNNNFADPISSQYDPYKSIYSDEKYSFVKYSDFVKQA